MVGSEPFASYGFSKKSCQKVIKNNFHHGLLVAKLNNLVVGFAIFERSFLNGFYLKLIAIDPSHRGLGIGNKLMDALEKETFKQKNALYLCVTDFNRKAQRFYKSRGYKKVGKLPDHFKKGIAELLFRKLAS